MLKFRFWRKKSAFLAQNEFYLGKNAFRFKNKVLKRKLFIHFKK